MKYIDKRKEILSGFKCPYMLADSYGHCCKLSNQDSIGEIAYSIRHTLDACTKLDMYSCYLYTYHMDHLGC